MTTTIMHKHVPDVQKTDRMNENKLPASPKGECQSVGGACSFEPSLDQVPTTEGLFAIGDLTLSASVAKRLEWRDIIAGLERHVRGDWGEVAYHVATANNLALRGTGRLFSKYHSKEGVSYCIFTHADRETTSVILEAEC